MSRSTPNSQITDAISDSSARGILMAAKLPKKTRSYAPVPHKVVMESTLEALDKANIKVLGQSYKAARNGSQGNGTYLLDGGDTQMNLRLVWQNSYDKSLPLAAAIGSNVIVCGNGLVMGDMGDFKRKHTGTVLIEFKESIGQYIQQAGEIFEKMVRDRERMKEITLTKRTSAELIGRMFLEQDIITATQLGIIKREIDAPSFDYGTMKKRDESGILVGPDLLWDTYNAITVSLKEAHPQHNIKQHINLHNFITKDAFVKEFA